MTRLLWFLALAASARAQLAVAILDTDPPGVRLTGAGQVTLVYAVTGTTNGVQVDLFRDDGQGRVSVAIPDPTAPPPPFRVTVPLKTDADGVENVFTAVARDLVSNETAPSAPFRVTSDDVGPAPPRVTAPPLPVRTPALQVRLGGELPKVGGAPDPGGEVRLREPGQGLLLGRARVDAAGAFTLLADLAPLVPGSAAALELFGVDAAGNVGGATPLSVTRLAGSPPTLEDARLDPPDGTITASPGASVLGTVRGDGGALAVHVFVGGRLSTQLTGLADGTPFRHTLSLPGEGEHALSAQVTYQGVAPDPRLATPLGVLTLAP